MTNETIETELEKKYTPSLICGECLHSRESHEKHNGHFMQCAKCNKLCDLDAYLTVHKPTDLETTYRIQSAREYSQYKVKIN